jgi:hypothetical protein
MIVKSAWVFAGALALAIPGAASAQEKVSDVPNIEAKGSFNLFGNTASDSGAKVLGNPVSASPVESRKGVEQLAVQGPGKSDEPAAKSTSAPDGKSEYSDEARLNKEIKVAEPDAPANPNVSFTAVVAPGAEPIKDGMKYRIWRKSGKRYYLAHEIGHSDKVALAPGDYRLEAKYGRAVKVEDFQVVSEKPMVHTVDLNAGWATLRLISHLNGKPLDGPTEWDLYTYGRGKDGKRVKIDSSGKTQPAYVLSAGHYYVEARHGEAEVNHVIEITAGHRYTYTLNLNAGTMRTFAEVAEGVDPMKPIVWEVYPAEGGDPVARNVAPEADFVLNEGRYVVVASQGDIVSRREINVRAGQSQDLHLTLE